MTVDDIRNLMAIHTTMKLSPAILNRAHVQLELPKQTRDALYREMKNDPSADPSSYPFPLTVGTNTVMISQGASYKRSKLIITFDVTEKEKKDGN